MSVQQASFTAASVAGLPPSDYYSVWAWVEYYDTSLGWKTLYKHESKDAVDRAKSASASVVTYEAIGLLPGKQHRFRVAWCRKPGDRKGCNCWSEVSSTLTQPTVFSAPKVPLPTSYSEEIEDLFERGPTDLKPLTPGPTVEPGDGLGPGAVWLAPDGPRVSSDGAQKYAYFPHSTTAKYAVPPSHANTFTEVVFKPLCTATKANPPSNPSCAVLATQYRVEVEARSKKDVINICELHKEPPQMPDPNNKAAYYYLAQLRYEPETYNIIEPELRIIRVGPSYPNNCSSTASPTLLAATDIATLCSSPGVDTAKLKNGSSEIHLRMRVETNTSNGQPAVFVTVAWDCSSTACLQKCEVGPYPDSEIEPLHPLLDLGQGGTTIHHWDARVESFDIGRIQ